MRPHRQMVECEQQQDAQDRRGEPVKPPRCARIERLPPSPVKRQHAESENPEAGDRASHPRAVAGRRSLDGEHARHAGGHCDRERGAPAQEPRRKRRHHVEAALRDERPGLGQRVERGRQEDRVRLRAPVEPMKRRRRELHRHEQPGAAGLDAESFALPEKEQQHGEPHRGGERRRQSDEAIQVEASGAGPGIVGGDRARHEEAADGEEPADADASGGRGAERAHVRADDEHREQQPDDTQSARMRQQHERDEAAFDECRVAHHHGPTAPRLRQ